VRTVGLSPRVEVGNPGFVRALFDRAGVPEAERHALADAIDRKDRAEVRSRLRSLAVAGETAAALETVSDLYGDTSILEEARRIAPWPETEREIARLVDVIAQFEDASELLVDLGMARRLSYYTGVTFRAYTFDFGQPLLGGGRYDDALLPYAAGFSIGLERLMEAMPRTTSVPAPQVVSLDDEGARRLRRAGVPVVRTLTAAPVEARAEARGLGAAWLLHDSLEYLGQGAPDPDDRTALEAIVAGGEEADDGR
jgi:ATP phosphoribosyltransferase regulatory subunit